MLSEKTFFQWSKINPHWSIGVTINSKRNVVFDMYIPINRNITITRSVITFEVKFLTVGIMTIMFMLKIWYIAAQHHIGWVTRKTSSERLTRLPRRRVPKRSRARWRAPNRSRSRPSRRRVPNKNRNRRVPNRSSWNRRRRVLNHSWSKRKASRRRAPNQSKVRRVFIFIKRALNHSWSKRKASRRRAPNQSKVRRVFIVINHW